MSFHGLLSPQLAAMRARAEAAPPRGNRRPAPGTPPSHQAAALPGRPLLPVERAKQLVLREQVQAQERLDDSAMELERLRAEFLSSSQPATPGAGKAKPRRHMAFF